MARAKANTCKKKEVITKIIINGWKKSAEESTLGVVCVLAMCVLNQRVLYSQNSCMHVCVCDLSRGRSLPAIIIKKNYLIEQKLLQNSLSVQQKIEKIIIICILFCL